MKKETPTSAMIRRMEADLKKSLDEVGAKYGYSLKFGNGSYTPTGNFTLKLVGNKDGQKSDDAERYDRCRIPLHLPPLGEMITFGIGSRKYKVVGINKTGTKVHGLSDGRTYLLPTGDVRLMWENVREKVEKAELMA